jgi:hypothetical protein
MPVLTAKMPFQVHLEVTILGWSDQPIRRDTDNRLKTVRDALRIPHTKGEVQGGTIPPDPCICLLEDDGTELVGDVASRTRRLLERPIPGKEDDVVLWIQGRIVRRGDA